MICEIEKIPISYFEIGTGNPILIIHGWNENAKVMSFRLEKFFNLTKNIKRVYVDLPGHGNTPISKDINSTDDILRVITKFTEKLFFNENFLLLGLSYGAYIARGLIYNLTKRIDGVCLLVPLIIGLESKRSIPNFVIVSNEVLSTNLPTNINMKVFNLLSVRNEKTLHEFVNYMNVVNNEPGNILFREKMQIESLAYSYSFDVDNLQESYKRPTLIVTARQDSVVGYENAYSIINNYPRATFVILDRAGHLLEDQVENLSQLILDWLKRVELERTVT